MKATQGPSRREPSLFEIVRAEGSTKLIPATSSMSIIRPTDARFPLEHCPASVRTLLAPVDDNTPTPLAHISMGDQLRQGGFRQASEFVNWDFYNKQHYSFLGDRANEVAWAPDPLVVRRQIDQTTVDELRESTCSETMAPTNIIAQLTQHPRLRPPHLRQSGPEQ